ncbi:MAG: ATP-dependent endonuclease [Phycisphaerales bacterium JB047]
MKLIAAAIHNYRSVIKAEFTLEPYSLIVGANNAGKSSLFAAICAFYDKEPFKFKANRDRPFVNASDDHTWVELEFCLSESEASSLKKEYLLDGNRLRVRRYLYSKELAHDNKNKSLSLYAYTTAGLTEEDFFYGSRNVGLGKLGSVIYVPAVTKVEDQAKLTGPSPLRDLMNGIVNSIVAEGVSYQQLSTAFDQFSADVKLEKTEDGRSLTGLESMICDELDDWGVRFELNIRPPTGQELTKTLIDYKWRDKSHSGDISAEDYGSGFQRSFIFSLIKVAAEYVGESKTPAKKSFSGDLNLLLFEEPEAFLHPPKQEVLSTNLRSLGARDDWQVLCTTHSSQFVSLSADDLPSMIRVMKSGTTSKCYQVSREAIEVISSSGSLGSGGVASEDEDELSADELRYFLWLNPDRTAAFFADHVLLVEGHSDQAFVRKLLALKRISHSHRSVYVLDCCGKFNMHRFMRLFQALGIRHSVLFDKDSGKKNSGKYNQRILDADDSKLTTNYIGLDTNLEKTLGIEIEGYSSDKARKILRMLEANSIPQSNLETYCGLVSSCLGPRACSPAITM